MKHFLFALLMLPLLAACSDIKETVGLGRNVPDEFDVVSNPPLTIPPDYILRPPQRGVAAPAGAVPAVAAAAQAVGAAPRDDAATTPGLAAFLSQSNAARAKPDIRATIDQESDGVVVKDKTFVDRVLLWKPAAVPPDPTVNETAEAARVKAEQEKTGTVTGDGAKINVPKPKAPLEGILD